MGELLRRSSVRGILYLFLLISLLSLAGCGGHEESASIDATSAGSAPSSNTKEAAGDASGGASDTTDKAKSATASAVPRKIIYNATVDLVAENLTTAQQKLMQIIKKYQGLIAETNVGGSAGSQRSGTWKIRIPVEQFDACLAELSKLGELQSMQTDSQDVTEEYYDIQARISNKQVEEKRLVMHLQKSTAKLADILAVEREISRVRGEIEQMQGRLRVLSNLTSLTTITVTLREIKEYVAPEPATFGEQVARSFSTSVRAMRDLLVTIVLVVAAFLPWAIMAALVLGPIWALARRSQAKQQSQQSSSSVQWPADPPDSSNSNPGPTQNPPGGKTS